MAFTSWSRVLNLPAEVAEFVWAKAEVRVRSTTQIAPIYALFSQLLLCYRYLMIIILNWLKTLRTPSSIVSRSTILVPTGSALTITVEITRTSLWDTAILVKQVYTSVNSLRKIFCGTWSDQVWLTGANFSCDWWMRLYGLPNRWLQNVQFYHWVQLLPRYDYWWPRVKGIRFPNQDWISQQHRP